MELASRNISPPAVSAFVPSVEKSTWVTTGEPAGEPDEANAALRWKSGLVGSRPSAIVATVTPAPSAPDVMAGSALMLVSASGFSWGAASVPHSVGELTGVSALVLPARPGCGAGSGGP